MKNYFYIIYYLFKSLIIVISIHITVMPKIDLTGIPQKIVNVPAGKPIVLNIPIKGRPVPVCSWFFGGAKMKDTLDRIKIETTAKFTKLTVRETTIDDTGDYTLEVKNITGTATEVIKVIILGKEHFTFSHRFYRSTATF